MFQDEQEHMIYLILITGLSLMPLHRNATFDPEINIEGFNYNHAYIRVILVHVYIYIYIYSNAMRQLTCNIVYPTGDAFAG